MKDHFINSLTELLTDSNGRLLYDIEPLYAMSRLITLEANEIYISKGDLGKRLAFIEKGVMRAYTHKENADEVTLFLRWEGQFIASHDTILHHRPSRFIYRALEPSILMEIDYDVLEDMLKLHPDLEPLRNFFLMRMLSETLQVMESFVLQSPEERYRELVTERSQLVNRVADKYIASMLGITPVSLSRIRKRMHQKGRN
ncbi:Crp/Fnr family transcriptional regulator [Pedobacter nototheniae]|uniref:Crp/Fnr family transcriptional regulator n=1 Tax=Pedobacter nototheniae TaxID=2488994 RepID=UPI00293191E6|nr:Crp/Fnr family transcriptional regulator [Pedobacter nototheniae]